MQPSMSLLEHKEMIRYFYIAKAKQNRLIINYILEGRKEDLDMVFKFEDAIQEVAKYAPDMGERHEDSSCEHRQLIT